VHAFLAFWRDLSLEANDELIAVHIGTLDLEIMHFVGSHSTIRSGRGLLLLRARPYQNNNLISAID
jgi:hypothetical protein